MKNIKLEIQYNGKNYFGWQKQKNQDSIQQTLEEVLSEFFKEDIEVTGCSRTDSKVHALSYICNFKSDTRIPVEKLKYALNPKLPRDIVVIDAQEKEETFHARYSCTGKQYVYKIMNSECRPVFQVEGCSHYKYSLDIEKMREAAGHLVGKHDFSAFKSTGSSVKTTVRTIYEINIEEKDNLITVSVSGDGFLYNMVRIIVGTLLEIGSGKYEPKEMKKILESKDRKKAGATAPPQGLYLKEVYYEV